MDLRTIGLIGLLLPLAGFAQDPAILVNRQGLAQQDLSIRGSSYAGTGISLNGINLKVPYSAHYHSELLRYGPLVSDARMASGLNTVSGGLVGTATYTVQPLQPQSISSLGIGTKERYRASTFASTENIGGFIDGEKARRIDYGDNDLERLTGGGLLQFIRNDWQIDILTAGQSEQYGAKGYYGIPSGVYARERTEDVLLFAGATKGELDGSFIRTGIGLREFNSNYRIPSVDFTSDVRSRYGSLMLEGRTLEIQHIALNLRADLEHERVSGDVGRHDRTRGTVLLLPEARFERFTLRAGMNSVFQTDESAEWLPQAGVDFFATDNLKLYASYSETIQQPDYQTLYYTGPYRIGNDTLQQQKVKNSELGFHQYLSDRFDWGASVFHRRQKDAMDWTKATSASTAWVATDLGTLDVLGVDATLSFRATDDLNLHFYYQWVDKDDYEFYAGLYELDYPEHLLGFSSRWQVSREFLLFAVQTLRYQTDNKVRNDNDFGAEASLGLHYDPRFAKNVRLSFLVENLWGSNFQAVPGLKPRPASVFTGITVAW
jgi:hypothetical protein